MHGQKQFGTGPGYDKSCTNTKKTSAFKSKPRNGGQTVQGARRKETFRPMAEDTCRFRLTLHLRLCPTQLRLFWTRENTWTPRWGNDGCVEHNGHPRLLPGEVPAKAKLLGPRLLELLQEVKAAGGACNTQRRLCQGRSGRVVSARTLRYVLGGSVQASSDDVDWSGTNAINYLQDRPDMSWVGLACRGASVNASSAVGRSVTPGPVLEFQCLVNGDHVAVDMSNLTPEDYADLKLQRASQGLRDQDLYVMCLFWASDEQVWTPVVRFSIPATSAVLLSMRALWSPSLQCAHCGPYSQLSYTITPLVRL